MSNISVDSIFETLGSAAQAFSERLTCNADTFKLCNLSKKSQQMCEHYEVASRCAPEWDVLRNVTPEVGDDVKFELDGRVHRVLKRNKQYGMTWPRMSEFIENGRFYRVWMKHTSYDHRKMTVISVRNGDREYFQLCLYDGAYYLNTDAPETFDPTPFDQGKANTEPGYWNHPARFKLVKVLRGGRPVLTLTLWGETAALGDGVHKVPYMGCDIEVNKRRFDTIALGSDVEDSSRLGNFKAYIWSCNQNNEFLAEIETPALHNGAQIEGKRVYLKDGDMLTIVSSNPVSYRASVR